MSTGNGEHNGLVTARMECGEVARSGSARCGLNQAALSTDRTANKATNDETKLDISFSSANIAIIGSGLSSSASILGLVSSLENQKGLSEPVKLIVFDSQKQFHRGIAYGNRSTRYSLTITNLREFLPDAARSDYIDWLKDNDVLVNQVITKCAEQISAEWEHRTRAQIANNDWCATFLPRSLFGCYMSEKVTNALDNGRKSGFLDYELITNEVVAIQRDSDRYTLSTRDGIEFLADSVLLALGSAPSKLLPGQFEPQHNYLNISTPFEPSVNASLDQIKQFCQSQTVPQTLVVVGSNASSIELLHHIDKQCENVDKVFSISTSSGYPHANEVIDDNSDYVPVFLSKLLQEAVSGEYVSAKAIYEAAVKDSELAENHSVPISLSFAPISNTFIAISEKLDDKEYMNFVCHYGAAIGRLQRRAGHEYIATIDSMCSRGKLNHITGFVERVDSDQEGLTVSYRPTKHAPQSIAELKCSVIVNCSGAEKLSENSRSTLISQLIRDNYISVNPSGCGIALSNDYSANEGMYVVGPLMAGNVINEEGIWHVEHCGRILRFGQLVAEAIVSNSLLKKTTQKTAMSQL